MGVLPDIGAFLSLGVPVIEDISQSAFARYPAEPSESEGAKSAVQEQSGTEEAKTGEPLGKCAGMYGVYTIFGMEDRDIVTAGGGAVLMAPGRREWIVLKKRLPQTLFLT